MSFVSSSTLLWCLACVTRRRSYVLPCGSYDTFVSAVHASRGVSRLWLLLSIRLHQGRRCSFNDWFANPLCFVSRRVFSMGRGIEEDVFICTMNQRPISFIPSRLLVAVLHISISHINFIWIRCLRSRFSNASCLDLIQVQVGVSSLATAKVDCCFRTFELCRRRLQYSLCWCNRLFMEEHQGHMLCICQGLRI